jgi:hypothetical protein
MKKFFASTLATLALAIAAITPAHALTTGAYGSNLRVTLAGHGSGTGSICGAGGTYYADIAETAYNYKSIASLLMLAASTGQSVTLQADYDGSSKCVIQGVYIDY